MAVQYKNTRNRGIHPIKYLYRSKPRPYFDLIFERDNGVMYPYMKDLNGDTCSGVFVLDCHLIELVVFCFGKI
jgi:hypothetical protein